MAAGCNSMRIEFLVNFDAYCRCISYQTLCTDKHTAANRHSPATLTEVFPCFFLGCEASARV
jgi:hypothetical protein